jgi:hypothetical protein
MGPKTLGTSDGHPQTGFMTGIETHSPTILSSHGTLYVSEPDANEHEAPTSLDGIPPRAETATGVYGPAAPAISEVAKKLAAHEGRNDRNRDNQILQWCREAAAQFENARIQVFIPILVENIVNSRMHHERYVARLALAAGIAQ